MNRREESEPAFIYVIFSFLLHLNKVKYHWSKSGKGEIIVNLIFFLKRGQQNNKKAFFFGKTFTEQRISGLHVVMKRMYNFPEKSELAKFILGLFFLRCPRWR